MENVNFNYGNHSFLVKTAHFFSELSHFHQILPKYDDIEGEILEKYYFGQRLSHSYLWLRPSKTIMSMISLSGIFWMVSQIWMIIWTKISDFSEKCTPFLVVNIDWPFQSVIFRLMHFQIRKFRLPKILFETHVYYATLNFDVNYHFWSKMIIFGPEKLTNKSLTRMTI